MKKQAAKLSEKLQSVKAQAKEYRANWVAEEARRILAEDRELAVIEFVRSNGFHAAADEFMKRRDKRG